MGVDEFGAIPKEANVCLPVRLQNPIGSPLRPTQGALLPRLFRKSRRDHMGPMQKTSLTRAEGARSEPVHSRIANKVPFNHLSPIDFPVDSSIDSPMDS